MNECRKSYKDKLNPNIVMLVILDKYLESLLEIETSNKKPQFD